MQLNNKYDLLPGAHFVQSDSTTCEDGAVVPALKISLSKDIKQSQIRGDRKLDQKTEVLF